MRNRFVEFAYNFLLMIVLQKRKKKRQKKKNEGEGGNELTNSDVINRSDEAKDK